MRRLVTIRRDATLDEFTQLEGAIRAALLRLHPRLADGDIVVRNAADGFDVEVPNATEMP